LPSLSFLFVASLSADEFTLVLKGLPARKAKHDIHTMVLEHAERLQEMMESPYLIDNSTIEIEITIGIEFSFSHTSNASHMIEHANFACHVAKKGQDKLAIYDSEQDAVIARQFQIFGGLKHALQNHELCLFYQPKIDMHLRKVTDVEALIRWISPEKGMVPPGDFIPVGESTGLIHPITRFVLDQSYQLGASTTGQFQTIMGGQFETIMSG